MISSAMQNKITVIMPALNEEKNVSSAINETLLAFETLKINGEIILVNDGSTDKTQEIIEAQLRRNQEVVRIIRHDAPRGIGFCFWEGVDAAQGNIVVMIPGDNENDPFETLRYKDLLEHVDIIIPFIFNRQARSIFRNMLSLIYRFIINTTFLVNFNYTNGTILYRKSLLKELDHRSGSFFFQTDILIRAVKKGYLFAEVPYKLGTRQSGKSKAVTFPSLYKVIKGYLLLIKDYYFSSNKKIPPNFSQDSQTALRRQ